MKPKGERIMRIFTMFVVLLTLSFAAVQAAPYSPTLLKLSAPGSIKYDFTGKDVTIPMTVTGTPATVVFFVYTLDKGSQIGKVKNGFLGWHYVNSIDTCVYMSTPVQYNAGKYDIVWNGRNIDGTLVAADMYTYYLWGYDGMSAKTLACNAVNIPQDMSGQFDMYNDNGTARNAPVFYPSPGGIRQPSGQRARAKWTLGGDPYDSTLIETTYTLPADNSYARLANKIGLMPGNHNKFFLHDWDNVSLQRVRKFTWTPNGQANQDMTFGEVNGEYQFQNIQPATPPGPITDQVSGLWVICAPHRGARTIPCEMHVLDPNDGSRIRVYDFARTWQNDEEYAYDAANALTTQQGPRFCNFTPASGGRIVCAGNQHCLKECINPYTENDAEVVVWDNSNGDLVGDRNAFEATPAVQKWLCQGGSSAGWVYDISADKNLFTIANQYDLGNISFAAFGPDGRGIGSFSFAGETAKIKFGILTVDTDCPFDGMYMDYNINSASGGPFKGLWFIAQDSFKGIIGNQVEVAESNPASFVVAQNTPNPFNPVTSISFTIAKAGHVTIDVFNSAGQKVDTIANASMSAGSHSVTWNASKFSAGVYFYTVKSGDFSRTMKMTLLK